MQTLALRSSMYAVLARGFSYPDESVIRFFNDSGDGTSVEVDGIGPIFGKLLKSVRSMALEELRSAHNFLFDQLSGPAPYEAEHVEGDDFGKSQIMADIMGFYRAFGVEPNGERPDHLAAELEFMHYLTIKEHHAQRAGQSDNASVCREAQENFFADHLAEWSESIADMMRSRNNQRPVPFYSHLIDLLQQFIKSERESLL